MIDLEEVELKELIRLGRKYKWATGKVRARLETAGVNLVRSDFYSESPTLADIETSFEYAKGSALDATEAVFDSPAIFNMERIRQFAESLVPFAADLDKPTTESEGFYWDNDQFSGTDAAALYALIKQQRPRRVVEIGSGYSTFIAHEALHQIGGGELICVDPSPRADITKLPDVRLLQQPVQQIDLEWLIQSSTNRDIVFYDGSHAIKTGSDAVFFYLKILPYLPRGTLIHAHDVRLPYPRNKTALVEGKIYWGEMYVLLAHLHNTARYEVLFASELLQRRLPEIARELMHGQHAPGGVSLWYRVK